MDLKRYENERQGQIDFFNKYLPRVKGNTTMLDYLSDNTDGILNGNLLEFKTSINDLNIVLFQAIKYLSNMRIKGKELPKYILLVDLNKHKAYKYIADDYLEAIEKVYIGSASKHNEGFIADEPVEIFEYSEMLASENLIKQLKIEDYCKINIDENCVVGWAERFYREVKGAKKADFIGDSTGEVKIIGEIRSPNHFKKFIYPYKGKTNIEFEYLMDKINDTLQKKNLGAFYTPVQYAGLAHELILKAIERVPEGNDFIILDRCGGTGNLEVNLPDELLEHCVISTVEYYEYKVLVERLGDKVRHIIPPIEAQDTFVAGLVKGADALSEDYINNPIIKQYVDNPNCNVILYENPPFSEANGTTGATASWKKSYVAGEMKKEVKGTANNDLANIFIWSGFKYYLNKPEDSYVLFSPIKYWKANHLIDKEFIQGYLFNRLYFHAKFDASISCILWANKDKKLEEIDLLPVNIKDGALDPYDKPKKAIRVHQTLAKAYYDRKERENTTQDGIATNLDGTEREVTSSTRVKTRYHKDMIGFLVANGTGFDNPDLNSGLVVAGRYDGNGFFIHTDNYLEKLPLFAASRYYKYNREFTDRSFTMKSGDGKAEYEKDLKAGKLDDYLRKVLLFTCFEPQNHVRSLQGSDGRLYINQLCLDTETLASKEIAKMQTKTALEEKLLKSWTIILKQAKKSNLYNPNFKYGLYQIDVELNTYDELIDDYGKKSREYHDNILNGAIKSLKSDLKEYYQKEIVPNLFKYKMLV